MENIKISLAAARVNAKMTQEAVARKMQISKRTLIKWEHGEASPPIVYLSFLSNLYSIPIDNLVLPKNCT